MTGRTFSRIHVVGGGSNAGYLNELTARATGKEVHAGPGEATAIGNITAQMLKAEFKTSGIYDHLYNGICGYELWHMGKQIVSEPMSNKRYVRSLNHRCIIYQIKQEVLLC